MNSFEVIITILLLTLGVQITRGLPFLVFGNKKELPKFIDYLGKVLPAAMMGLLVVYCFKDINFLNVSEIVPTLSASLAVAGIHIWKRNTILSISFGVIIYMVLIRVL